MVLSLAKAIIGYLKEHPEKRFTAQQIAEWVFATYPDECQEKRANSHGGYIKSDADLVRQLVAEINSQRPHMQAKHPELKTVEGRPHKYYYSERSGSAEVATVENEDTSAAASTSALKIDEHALYPLLSRYLWEEFGVFLRRIDGERSSNKHGPSGNRWLYPDVAGAENLDKGWHRGVHDCVTQYSDRRTKLQSFEVKLSINRSNVHKYFFQAVSNPSWASFDYLVVAELGGTDMLRELRMLFAIHGVGFIRLGVDSPVDSQVLIPARGRDETDWGIANRLATENRDFLEYTKLVKQFYQTGETHPADWDVPEMGD